MQRLLEHTQRELELIGEDQDTIFGYLEIMKAYIAMGASGGMATLVTKTVSDLLQFKTLTNLTDSPAEWTEIGEGIWTNVRNPKAFSNDAGRHYWFGKDLSQIYESERSGEWHSSSPEQQSLW